MIIGISGKMGTGKTTLADLLVGTIGGKRISFADALRKEVADAFGIPESMLGDRLYKEAGKVTVGNRVMTPRALMQWWGGMRRETDRDYWLHKTYSNIGGRLTVIDDVRYQNEARFIDNIGGLLVRLEPYVGWEPGGGAGHISETDLDNGGPQMHRFYPAFGGLGEVAEKVARMLGGAGGK